jgi:Major capsid protein Gp23
MSAVQSLIESANPWQSMQNDASRLATKWGKSGLLEGLKDHDKTNMAVMLENQAKQLVVETSQTGTGGTFTPGTGEQWAGVALPLVRKVFGQIASKEFVSVQPMSLPAGLVFYLDFQYGTSKLPFTSGQSLYGTSYQSGNSGFGNLAAGGLYGAGRFGYSTNQFSASNATVSATATALFTEVDFDSAVSGTVQAGNMVKVTFLTSSISSYVSANEVRAFVLSGSSVVSPTTTLTQYTTYNSLSTGDTIDFFVSGSNKSAVDAVTGSITVFYNKKPQDNARGDFEDTAAGTFSVPNAQNATSIAIPEINVQLRSETIAAKTKKLKAQWTPEFAQDLNAYQNLDAEAELTSMLSEYISLEIDLEILDMLINNAPIVENWSAKVGNQIDAAGQAFAGNTTGVYYTQMTWFQTLGIKLQKVSNQIHQRTLRGGANFMVVSPAVATILESIPGFAADTDGAADTMKYAFGVQKVGQLNSRYKVYKNPYMLENVILMGFRGNQFLETGAVYAPYIPLIMTPLVYDPNTFTPRKGIMTRYAKKMVRPEFYGLVKVADLNIV